MSQGGVGLWACGHCNEEKDTEGRTDRESEPSLGNYAKTRDYLPQWDGEETVVDLWCSPHLAQNDVEQNLFRFMSPNGSNILIQTQ